MHSPHQLWWHSRLSYDPLLFKGQQKATLQPNAPSPASQVDHVLFPNPAFSHLPLVDKEVPPDIYSS